MWIQSEFDNIFEMLKKIQEDATEEYTYEVVLSTEEGDKVVKTFKSKYNDLALHTDDRMPIALGSNEYIRLVEESKTNDAETDAENIEKWTGEIHQEDEDGHACLGEFYIDKKTGKKTCAVCGYVDEGPPKKTESKTNEAEKTAPPVPQTMKPQEEPVINAEDHSMEDISKDEKEKKDKEKEKAAKETGTQDMQKIEDKDLEQKQPKKESRQQLHLCNKCFKTFRSNESICIHCKSNEVEKIIVEKKEDKKVETKVQESTYNVIFGDKHIETIRDAISKADAMAKAKVAYPISRYNNRPIAITNVFKLEGEAIKTGLITYVVTLDDGSSIEVQAKSPADVLDIIKAKNLKKNVVSTTPVEESKVNEELNIRIRPKKATSDSITWWRVELASGFLIRAFDNEVSAKEYYEKILPIAKESENVVELQRKLKESKVNETVEELVGESDIDADDQITLRWALEKDVIPKQWPAKEIMFDELAKAGEVGANVATEVDIYANYLKYVLLPRAKEAYSKQSVKESVLDDVQKAAVGTTSLEELKKAVEIADEMIKQGVNKSAWQVARDILQKEIDDKKKESKSTEVKEGEGSIVGSTKGVYEVEYADVAGEKKTTRLFAFDKEDATTTIKKSLKVKEVLGVKRISKVTEKRISESVTDDIVLSVIDVYKDEKSISFEVLADIIASHDQAILDEVEKKLKEKGIAVAEGKVPAESDKEDTKIKKLTEDELEKEKSKFPSPLIDKLKQFAEEHNMTFEELIDLMNKELGIKEQELKLSEQEKDGYTVVAKGLVDKAAADRIATEKKGMAVADADDPKKWQVIVKEA